MMKGKNFKNALREAGYTQVEFAQIMGVHRQTIGLQCRADEVESFWVYALIGLIALKNAKSFLAIVENPDN